MGTFDTLIDRKNGLTCQVKISHCALEIFYDGDKLPIKDFNLPKDFTIVLPKWEGCKFALVKKGRLFKLTNSIEETFSPYYSKWGSKLKLTINTLIPEAQERIVWEEEEKES